MASSILVTRRPPGVALELLADSGTVDLWAADSVMPHSELLHRAKTADALYCMLTDRVDRDLLQAAKKLRVVSNMAVGVDNIDLAACTERGIPVGHTPGVLTEATADLAMGLLIAAARRIGEAAAYVKDGNWGDWRPDLLLGHDINSAVIGIVGMGRIGEAVSRRAYGFGASIVYSGPHAKPDIERAFGAVRRDLTGLLTIADHVIVTAPLKAETYHLINEASFRIMQPTATLVNVARGPIVDTGALVDALRSGAIAAAALDVTDPEPLRADHPLTQLPNCIVTPHIGSASKKTRAAMAGLAARNVINALAGDPMEACANPTVYAG